MRVHNQMVRQMAHQGGGGVVVGEGTLSTCLGIEHIEGSCEGEGLTSLNVSRVKTYQDPRYEGLVLKH